MKNSIKAAPLLLAGLTPLAGAQHVELEEIVVTATPLETEDLDMVRSSSVLTGEVLQRNLNNSIGETVNGLPGVHNAYFGPGVGRPIIRGQDGARVAVLENNIGSNDVSNVSADHAVSIEPFLARQIEVLRGPATLLYGSDTIGGVVNVKTNRIPDRELTGPLSGSVTLQGDSVSDRRFAGLELNGRQELDSGSAIGFHLDGFYRDSDDIEIPGIATLEPDPDGDSVAGTLDNSFVETDGFAAGFSYLGSNWDAGLAVSTFDTLYGIPGPGEEEEEEDEKTLAQKGGGEDVSIDLSQTRIDGRLNIAGPFAGFDNLKLLISNNDYEHQELEGDEIGTRFEADTLESRLELTHAPWGGWRGVIGVQYQDRDFSALGEEAFVPPSKTRQIALFLLEERQLGDFRIEAGLRLEDQEVTTALGQRADHEPFSVSLGTVYQFTDDLRLALNVARAERAPAEEELFANGPHLATRTFEIGNANLEEERSTSFEVSLRGERGPLRGSLTFFHNDFDDFIYLEETGLIEDGLPVRNWVQDDAELTGFEGEIALVFRQSSTGFWETSAFFDTVDADVDNGTNVPRTPPTRIGAAVDWHWNQLQLGLDAVNYKNQDDTAPLETPTDSYTLVNFDAVYRMGGGESLNWELFVRARNLNDEEARNHTSFLKDFAPLPGRNFIFGVRASF